MNHRQPIATTPTLNRKQRIYQDMLWITLPILRNYATWPWWQRQRYVSMLRFETELIHNLRLLVTEHNYVDHDIHFLNGQARDYTENCNPKLSGLYLSQIACIAALFQLVPEARRHELHWAAPLIEPAHKWKPRF